jgi:hypothetical protein
VHHEYLAIEAGVQIGAIAMLWVDHDVLVLINDVDNVQLDAELLGDPQRVVAFNPVTVVFADGVSMPFDAKAGKEIDAFDLDGPAAGSIWQPAMNRGRRRSARLLFWSCGWVRF